MSIVLLILLVVAAGRVLRDLIGLSLGVLELDVLALDVLLVVLIPFGVLVVLMLCVLEMCALLALVLVAVWKFLLNCGLLGLALTELAIDRLAGSRWLPYGTYLGGCSVRLTGTSADLPIAYALCLILRNTAMDYRYFLQLCTSEMNWQLATLLLVLTVLMNLLMLPLLLVVLMVTVWVVLPGLTEVTGELVTLGLLIIALGTAALGTHHFSLFYLRMLKSLVMLCSSAVSPWSLVVEGH